MGIQWGSGEAQVHLIRSGSLWLGVAIVAAPVLQGWQYATLVSPVFVFVLLNFVSGVPMLERRSDREWGGQEAYEAFKAKTPVLILRPPR